MNIPIERAGDLAEAVSVALQLPDEFAIHAAAIEDAHDASGIVLVVRHYVRPGELEAIAAALEEVRSRHRRRLRITPAPHPAPPLSEFGGRV